jgi:hypothetical protein
MSQRYSFFDERCSFAALRIKTKFVLCPVPVLVSKRETQIFIGQQTLKGYCEPVSVAAGGKERQTLRR